MSSTFLIYTSNLLHSIRIRRRRRRRSNSKLSPRVGKKGPFCISRKDVVAREHPFQWRNNHSRSLTLDSSSAKNYTRPMHLLLLIWHHKLVARLSHAAQFPRATIIRIPNARFEKKGKGNELFNPSTAGCFTMLTRNDNAQTGP